jgi:hypothetical protein
MSEQNVEIVRRCYEAFARHRFPSEQFAEEIEWRTSPEMPDTGTYRGRENVLVDRAEALEAAGLSE